MNPLYDLRPGDSMDVIFPEGFTLEYTKSVYNDIDKYWCQVSFTKVCERMNSWYWDDDDHCCLDHYFYETGANHHFAKLHDLTKESIDKVMRFINENYR
jgi:hypothetical protein